LGITHERPHKTSAEITSETSYEFPPQSLTYDDDGNDATEKKLFFTIIVPGVPVTEGALTFTKKQRSIVTVGPVRVIAIEISFTESTKIESFTIISRLYQYIETAQLPPEFARQITRDSAAFSVWTIIAFPDCAALQEVKFASSIRIGGPPVCAPDPTKQIPPP
jgi:hypothetical protein